MALEAYKTFQSGPQSAWQIFITFQHSIMPKEHHVISFLQVIEKKGNCLLKSICFGLTLTFLFLIMPNFVN